MRKIFVAILFQLGAVCFANAQHIDSMMAIYAEQYPQQKIYVHFDKGVYRAGETIFFKAYIFEGYQPALNSKNLFAELIDKDGTVVQRKIYPFAESSAAGSFDLPANTAAGHLTMRAYTTWMLNFDTAFLFKRNLDVVSKTGAAAAEKVGEQPRTVSFQFFPEGGDLVSDLESVVAFKANDEHGVPVYVSGNILNSKGQPVQAFKAQHDGMGATKFTPAAGETYTAEWKDDKGVAHTTPLPVAKAQGVVLQIQSSEGKKTFVIKRSDGAPKNYQHLIVEAHMAQQMVYRAKVPLQDILSNSGSIPVSSLPAGVLQITVFSENWEPLAERIVMVNNDNYSFSAKMRPTETSFKARGKNSFEIQVDDTLLSNLSVSVTDIMIANKASEDNIISRMLLTGDIRGEVTNPTYYFSNTSDSTEKHLDLVLLTHGWRRFKWADLASNKRPTLKFPKDEYLSLKAKVFGITSFNPLQRDEQMLAIVTAQDSSKQFIQIPKTGTDVFSLNNIMFFDTATIHYQFTKEKRLDKEAAVVFSNGLYGGVKKVDISKLPYYFSTDKDTIMLNRAKFLAQQNTKFESTWNGKSNVLQDVIVKTRVKTRIEELDEKYANGLFRGDGYSFDMTDNNALDILSFLQGRVAGLTISNGSEPSITWRGSNTDVFIDEMKADIDQLLGMSPADIAYIKVLRPPFFGATGGGAGGAIAVYTKKGTDVKQVPGKGLNRSQVVGYSKAKEFYVPDYSNSTVSSEAGPDYRSTLYWNPFIFMDATRQTVKVQFYNNDITKAFRVVLEGVNEAGKLVHIEKIIQ